MSSRILPKGRYLVLGGTGLVGSHALLALKDSEGIQVRATYHTRNPHVFADNISYVHADLMDRVACKSIMQDIDYVLMFAGVLSTAPVIAKDPLAPAMTNLIITSQSMEAAYYANVKKFVWLSSTTAYPSIDGILTEDQMFQGDPSDVYYPIGWMTRYAETLCRMYSEKLPRNMISIALRPTLIYGEYDEFDFERGHFLPALIRRVVERQNPVEVWGTGEQTRDMIHARDVVDASLLAIEKVDRFEAFNIAYGKSFTINDVLDKIIAIDEFADATIVHLTSKPITVATRSFSPEKAKALLGFEAATGIDEGLRKTIRWFRESSAAISGARETY